MRGHIITNHPLSGASDRIHPEKPMSCASCHNPHSSDQETLLRYDFRDKVTPYGGNFCATCHWDIAIGSKPPTPPWSSPEQKP
ncbi:MAG: hypothetical protein A2X94_06655 [Bdellovibrionales bacterium GWB1_55_8]|nr:MAG: hypothetical protein A2X94_06655 [Bdellovibrionales bacterium GWB1_55_8]